MVDDGEIELTFGALEALLAEINSIASSRRSQFQARLRNLQKLDVPRGVKSGRGRAVGYGPGQIVELALAIELTQLGLLPERVAAVIEGNQYPIFKACCLGARALREHGSGYNSDDLSDDSNPLSMFLHFDPSALSSLMTSFSGDVSDPAAATFFYAGQGVVREQLVPWTTGKVRRLSLINVTSLLWEIAQHFEERKREVFFKAVESWSLVGEEAMYLAAGMIDSRAEENRSR